MQLIDTHHIYTAEDTRNLYHLVLGLMEEAQANLSVSSFMGILLGELLALSSCARMTVLQETEILISGLHETVDVGVCSLHQSVPRDHHRVAKGSDWPESLQSFECSSPCIVRMKNP